MWRRWGARVAGGVAAAVLALVALPVTPVAARSLVDLSDSMSIDCTGWAITATPFGVDVDGDGMVTVRVSVSDANGVQLDDQTFTFPPGTSQDLQGTFTTPPTLNNLTLTINDEQVKESYTGSCDGLRWAKPYVEHSTPKVGDTEFTVATYSSCYGTTLALELRDEQDRVVGRWSTQTTTRLSFRSFATLSLSSGFEAGTYQLTSVCGTFDAPLSPVFTSVPLVVAAPATTTTGSVLPPAQGAEGEPSFTG